MDTLLLPIAILIIVVGIVIICKSVKTADSKETPPTTEKTEADPRVTQKTTPTTEKPKADQQMRTYKHLKIIAVLITVLFVLSIFAAALCLIAWIVDGEGATLFLISLACVLSLRISSLLWNALVDIYYATVLRKSSSNGTSSS